MTGSRLLLGITLSLALPGLLAGCSGSTAVATPLTSPASTAATASDPSFSPVASIARPSASVASAGSPVPSSQNLRLTSTAFAEGGSIPRKYSCDGANLSPPLAWDGVPGGAMALVLIVDDPDASGFIHWVAFDIPVAPNGELQEGASAADPGLLQGTNGFGKVGWGGPCPPSGTHRYRFRLLAIRTALGLSGAPTAVEVLAAAKDKTLGETTLTARYKR